MTVTTRSRLIALACGHRCAHVDPKAGELIRRCPECKRTTRIVVTASTRTAGAWCISRPEFVA